MDSLKCRILLTNLITTGILEQDLGEDIYLLAFLSRHIQSMVFIIL
jgi:hypothetical protein